MSADELAANIGRGLDAIPTDTLHHAVSHLREAEQALTEITHGSSSSELPMAVRRLHQGHDMVAQVAELLDAVKSNMMRYLAQLGVSAPAHPVVPQRSPSAPPPARTASGTTTPEQIESLRGALPPRVPKPNPQNRKTHGRWIDASGTEHAIISGKDDDADEAWRLLKCAGMPANREPVSTTHVEVKLAARMVRQGQRHVEVVINNRPCPGPYGCDELLPVILPAGYSMTVRGPNYRKTYTGGEQW